MKLLLLLPRRCTFSVPANLQINLRRRRRCIAKKQVKYLCWANFTLIRAKEAPQFHYHRHHHRRLCNGNERAMHFDCAQKWDRKLIFFAVVALRCPDLRPDDAQNQSLLPTTTTAAISAAQKSDDDDDRQNLVSIPRDQEELVGPPSNFFDPSFLLGPWTVRKPKQGLFKRSLRRPYPCLPALGVVFCVVCDLAYWMLVKFNCQARLAFRIIAAPLFPLREGEEFRLFLPLNAENSWPPAAAQAVKAHPTIERIEAFSVASFFSADFFGSQFCHTKSGAN